MIPKFDLRKLRDEIKTVIVQKKHKAIEIQKQLKLYSSIIPPEDLQLKYAFAKSEMDEAQRDLVEIDQMLATHN